jgi:hypothetical protein
MLGEQFADLKGNTVGVRVLDVADTMEISVSLSGNMRGTPVNQFATYVNRGFNPQGVSYGKVHGTVMAEESKIAGEPELAAFTGEYFGRIDSSGNMKWRSAFSFQTSSTGKLTK